MLPKLDGLEVCRRLRAESAVPIIMLTARDDELDKVVGLELGADDYITKPFSIREFRSRVRALLRRAALSASRRRPRPRHRRGRARASTSRRRTVELDGRRVELTYVEFELLRTLAAKPGRVYSRQALLEALWGDSDYREPRTIDVHVRHLREKLERDPRSRSCIQTVRGVGYRFREREAAPERRRAAQPRARRRRARALAVVCDRRRADARATGSSARARSPSSPPRPGA